MTQCRSDAAELRQHTKIIRCASLSVDRQFKRNVNLRLRCQLNIDSITIFSRQMWVNDMSRKLKIVWWCVAIVSRHKLARATVLAKIEMCNSMDWNNGNHSQIVRLFIVFSCCARPLQMRLHSWMSDVSWVSTIALTLNDDGATTRPSSNNCVAGNRTAFHNYAQRYEVCRVHTALYVACLKW